MILFDFIKKERLYISIILLVFVIEIMIFCGHNALFFIDIGREAIIPAGIFQGKVLYRDIWNIYGPLSYFINAFAYFLFGTNLNSLYTVGVVNSFIYTFVYYFLCREFLDKSLSTLITIFVMVVCMFNITLFNFILPYSYATVYGLCAYCIASLLIIKYIKTQNPSFAFTSFLFAGIAFANKIEFLPLFIILLLVVIFIKPIGKFNIAKSVLSFAIVPICCSLILFWQGFSLHNLSTTIQLLTKYSQLNSVVDFQKFIGFYFDFNIFIHNFVYFLILLSLFIINYKIYVSKYKNRVFNIFFYCATAIIAIIITGLNPYMFSFLPILLTLLFLFRIKQFYKNPAVFTLVLLAIGGSLRTFYSLNMALYGQFTLPWVLLGLIVLINYSDNNLADKKPIMQKYIKFIMIILLISNGYFVFSQRIKCNYPIETARGKIYTWDAYGKSIDDFVTYLKNNTQGEDILVLPEGALVNFLLDKNVNYMYYSLIQDYIPIFDKNEIDFTIKQKNIKYIATINGYLLSSNINDSYYKKILLTLNNNYTIEKEFKSPQGDVIMLYRHKN